MARFEHQLSLTSPAFVSLIQRVPLQDSPPLPPDWLRCEMLERYQVIRHADLQLGSAVMEIGSGGHAISTLPLAFELGPKGRLFAIERSRWSQFWPVVRVSGMEDRIRPVACDARHLPFRRGSIDVAVCIHGIRSLGTDEEIVEVFQEMFRVAPRVFLAESLPIANNDAQAAHLRMYNLRERVFEATTGRKDDRKYLPLRSLGGLVERAGGVVENSATLDIALPHALAYFPRTLVESVPGETERSELLRRWDEAKSLLDRHGEDHPPVGMIIARRS